MIRSIALDVAPTARDVQNILIHLEEELRALGARVERTPYGAIRFRLPAPWRAPHLGMLHAASSGRATVGAAAGEPWRVRYELKFPILQWATIFMSVVVVVLGIRTGRFIALYALAAVWLICFALPYAAATLRFRRLVVGLIRDVTSRGYSAARSGP